MVPEVFKQLRARAEPENFLVPGKNVSYSQQDPHQACPKSGTMPSLTTLPRGGH